LTAGQCIFCRIAAGEIPAKIVARNDEAIAFRDIDPKAPTHILVIPRRHIASASHLEPDDTSLAGRLIRMAAEIAAAEGIAASGYRLVINTGAQGGQSVDHLHVHMLGGRSMHWPPG
jgi:histidine triad (HIT) family protein